FMHCLLIFFSWGLLAPKPLGVFRYRLLSYTSTWDCSSMLNLRRNNSPKTNFAVINVILSSHLTHSSAVALHEMLKVTAT
ncbi:hypothetical protein, partial [Prevotella jejuni]